jgi:hypothetical protein
VNIVNKKIAVVGWREQKERGFGSALQLQNGNFTASRALRPRPI